RPLVLFPALCRSVGAGALAVALVGAAAAVAHRSVHVRLHARSGDGRRPGVLVDVVLGLLLLPAPLALVGLIRRAVAARRALLAGPLFLPRPLVLVDRLVRVVLVLRFGVGRRAVALVDVPAVPADAGRIRGVACGRAGLVR